MSKTAQVGETPEAHLPPAAEPQIPQFRRNIFPSSIVLSADDLSEFSGLIAEANERAKKLEIASFDLEKVDSKEEAEGRVNRLMQIEYEYEAKNGDLVQGPGIPKTGDHTFPEELQSFYISNSSISRREIKVEPMNVVDVYFRFKKPSLKIDFQTLPSNPTENTSVINIYGRDEDWVISTADRINEFLRRKRSFRPIIHGAGTYDYLLFLAFLPLIIWLYYQYTGGTSPAWFSGQSVFFNVILGIYAFLFSLMLARFLFQYVRWLFPPIEYYKKSRVGAYVHRGVAGSIGSAVLLSAIYEFIKSVVTPLF